MATMNTAEGTVRYTFKTCECTRRRFQHTTRYNIWKSKISGHRMCSETFECIERVRLSSNPGFAASISEESVKVHPGFPCEIVTFGEKHDESPCGFGYKVTKEASLFSR